MFSQILEFAANKIVNACLNVGVSRITNESVFTRSIVDRIIAS